MCQEIMLAVTGFPFRGVRGLLRDYHRGTIRGEVYPGIVPRRGEVVEYAPCSLLLALRSLLSAPCSILPFLFSMLYALCSMLFSVRLLLRIIMRPVVDLQDERIFQGYGWAVDVILGVDVEHPLFHFDSGVAEFSLQDVHELVGGVKVGLRNSGAFFEPA